MTSAAGRLHASALLAWFVVGPAGAIAPATDEQLLCHATRIAEVEVVSGRGGSCIMFFDGRCLAGPSHLTVKLTRVVASIAHGPGTAGSDALIEGATYDVAVNASSPVRGLPQGAFVAPSDRAATDDEVERAFRSTPLVLGLSPSAAGIFAHVWLRSEEPWIFATLARQPYPRCPSALPDADRPPGSS